KEEEQMVRFTQMNQDLLQSGMKAEIFSGILAPVSTALNNLSYTIIVGVGAVLILTGGNMSLGIISNFMIYSKQFSRPIQELANQMSTLLSAVAGAERVFEVLDAEEEVQDEKDAMELTEVKGNVHFSNVSFSYIEGKPVLKNIEIQAKQGQTIALVGPTGAGKTTIMNLLMRFYDTEEGTVFVEGKNIRNLKRSNLREQMGMVLQDTYLFSGTVEENIKYGKQDATQEEVEYAARLANAHDFISRLPQGYQTPLGDGGGNLSQGQRQMISIARVMLNNPKILILDEATSSIDTQTEQKIQEAMNVLMQGRTNFVIAHRLSTIRNADKIAVIQHGELKEMGTHQELLAKKGFYYQMYFSQFQDVSGSI
ncbi:MAG: ABC transporter ATP-binding protein, partial [Epulopiscium sp.]|nr:ABC transporter ATP-binding protein [Candidatus Epulonipiscium sp.]